MIYALGPAAFTGLVWGMVGLVFVVFWYVVWTMVQGSQ